MPLPKWLFIHHHGPFQIRISPIEISSEGEIRKDKTIALNGSIDQISIECKNTLEDYTPIGARQKNFVVVGSETIIKLSEILKAEEENFLCRVASLYDYVEINIQRGRQSWKFFGTISSYTEKLIEGKCNGELTVFQAASSEQNPDYK